MKVAATSDLHGYLPDVPECDVLVIAGDIGPATKTYHDNTRGEGTEWMMFKFIPWTLRQPCEHVVYIGGNHDFVLQECGPPYGAGITTAHYLQDSGCEIDGVKFWGSPWTSKYFDWAFMLEEDELAKKWDMIPDDTDVLLTHGPPLGLGDVNNRGDHRGSSSLLKWHMKEPARKTMHFFGHIHECHGQSGASWANVSYVDERYRPVGVIEVFDVESSDSP